MIQWNNSLSIGVDEIDNQHKMLVDMVNKVHGLRTSGKDEESQIMGIISDMTQYAIEHFSTEERYMDQYDYPEMPPHQAKHEDFVEKVSQVEKDCLEGKYAISMDILIFLTDWLVTHSNDSDKKMGV